MYNADWVSLLSQDSRRYYDAEVSEASCEAFSDNTMLLPYIVLDTVIEKVVAILSDKGHPVEELFNGLSRNEDVERYIWNRTVLAYQNNEEWRKRLKESDPRPFYYAFVKHWFSEILKAADPVAYKEAKYYLDGH